jgi:hypothetical protein
MRRALFAILTASLALNGVAGWTCSAHAASKDKRSNVDSNVLEGRISTVTIEVGPFDLHRKYRSMEGPYVSQSLRVSDLIFSEMIALPESMVVFIEPKEGKQNSAPTSAPSMNGAENSADVSKPAAGVSTKSSTGAKPAQTDSTSGKPLGLIDTAAKARELYWFKGLKLEVLDENGNKLPTAEFICHLNIDADYKLRREAFEKTDVYSSSRLITLTQGQTDFHFPPGFAVPIASDEMWKFVFQAANRTTAEHRRVKQLCTLEFIKDSDLVKPIKALLWFNPYIAVVTDKGKTEAHDASAADCLGQSSGESADNMVKGTDYKDSHGRMLNGHWAVPPGTTTYESPVYEGKNSGFSSRDRKIHAVWSHVHPLCTKSSLIMCDGGKRRTIFTTAILTSTSNGLEITHIDDILSPKGIKIKQGKQYELEATYHNSTGVMQDSMVALGVFCHNDLFKKPDWSRSVSHRQISETCTVENSNSGQHERMYCGIRPSAH